MRFCNNATLCLLLAIAPSVLSQGGNDDTFNYKNTDENDRDFGPEDWGEVECPDLDQCVRIYTICSVRISVMSRICLPSRTMQQAPASRQTNTRIPPLLSQKGWPEDWVLGVDWELEKNSCKHCPKGESDDNNQCEKHHQSPIEMKRSVAINETDNLSYRECIDWHWMKYEDSSCSWQHIRSEGAFTIERHALTMRQPFEPVSAQEELEHHPLAEELGLVGYQLKCFAQGKGRVWGRIDFSKGFNKWWFLSHMDMKIPSEHTQEGKRYSAEVQLHHFYSASRNWVDEIDNQQNENEMATISIFLDAAEGNNAYPYLDRLICEWRNTEEQVRAACGLPSVGQYHGCFPNKRGYTPYPTESPTTTKEPTAAPVESVRRGRRLGQDLADNLLEQRLSRNGTKASTYKNGKPYLVMGPENWRDADWTDEEWEYWAEAKSNFDRGVATPAQKAFLGEKESDWIDWAKAKNSYEESGADESTLSEHERKLIAGDHLHFHNYQFLIDVKTEYYFRYQGTSTIPPCYGAQEGGSRANTNHWRVIKDPIRVHPRQIEEMSRLIRDRIDPDRCREDTAAKVERDGTVDVSRPLMETNYHHFKTFCECPNWRSKWPEDKKWCRMTEDGRGDYGEDRNFRFNKHPYWFDSDGEY